MKQIFLCFLLPFYICASEAPYVIVSVAPHKFFVEKIAKDTVQVYVMVPAYASVHTYEPTPKEILKCSSASLWFKMGEAFEKKAIQSLQAYNSKLELVDLRKNLILLPAPHAHPDGNCCGGGSHHDLHIWLSLRMGKIQAETIAKALIEKYPQHRTFYEANLKEFLSTLTTLDQKFSKQLAPFNGKTLFVSHPAYAYFCRDYGLKQLSIEFEGKDPTPQSMTALLEQARHLGIHAIFVQSQYSTKGAILFAQLLSAKIITLDPYSENYFQAMEEIANQIQENL